MNGFTDEQIIERIIKFQEFAEKNNFEVVTTFFQYENWSKDTLKKNDIIHIPVFLLSMSLKKMSQCNIVYFAKGWENARGCKIEHEVALQYGLEIIYEANELNESV